MQVPTPHGALLQTLGAQSPINITIIHMCKIFYNTTYVNTCIYNIYMYLYTITVIYV